jgi:hypothetical protein
MPSPLEGSVCLFADWEIEKCVQQRRVFRERDGRRQKAKEKRHNPQSARYRKTQRLRLRPSIVCRCSLSFVHGPSTTLNNKAAPASAPTAVQGEAKQSNDACALRLSSSIPLPPHPIFPSALFLLLSFPANVASPIAYQAATARPMHGHYRKLVFCHSQFSLAYFSCVGCKSRGARSLLSCLGVLHRLSIQYILTRKKVPIGTAHVSKSTLLLVEEIIRIQPMF